MTSEQTAAFKYVTEWVYLDQSNSLASTAAASVVDDFGVQKTLGKGGEKVVFDLHSHSKFSDGFLSPSKLLERAHGNGVIFSCFFFLFFCFVYSNPSSPCLFFCSYPVSDIEFTLKFTFENGC